MSIASGLINRSNQSAAEIVEEMVGEAVKCLAGSAIVLEPVASHARSGTSSVRPSENGCCTM